MNAAGIVNPSLAKAQRDLTDATNALASYWSRGPSDLDYRVADLHMAAESLLRAVSCVARAVERIAELVED